MTHRPGESTTARLKQQLQPTPECIPTERFAEVLRHEDRNHMAACARCQTEFALWREFIDGDAFSAGGHGSRMAAELRRRLPWCQSTLKSDRRRPSFPTRTYIAAAASIGLAVICGYVFWDPEPLLQEATSLEHTYRSLSIHVMFPTGDLDRPPHELAWVAVAGAVGYDVRVLEADGTVLWETTSKDPRVQVPGPVVAQFIPGKTIVWDVIGRNSAGIRVALSGTQRFHVRVHPTPRR
jgi:hypothetical protein